VLWKKFKHPDETYYWNKENEREGGEKRYLGKGMIE
jgi:uncharacterized short protein YbdD (DUF466 family)